MRKHFAVAVFALLPLIASSLAWAQSLVFQRALDVGIKDPVVLDVSLSKADVMIGYSRDGQVAIYAFIKDEAGKGAAVEFLKTGLAIEQKESHVTIRNSPNSLLPPTLNIAYRIDVPFRTTLTSTVETGNQKVIGIAGPATLTAGAGDIDTDIVRYGLVTAKTGKGKIACTRTLQVDAETGNGSITLTEDGPSKAVVKKGLGRIEVAGARGGVEALTDGGDVHVKAVLNGDWRLNSASGSIRIELPAKSQFEFEASTSTGQISLEREGMEQPSGDAHQFHQKMNGGGRLIQAHTASGNIFIQ